MTDAATDARNAASIKLGQKPTVQDAKALVSRTSNEIDEAQDEGFKPLTREEAEKIRQSNQPLSLWKVVVGQACVGVLVMLIAWVLTGQLRIVWSAGYGALAVVVPAAFFARGLSRQKSMAQGNVVLAGFFVWELVKVTLTVAMLFAAPRLIAELSWLALVAGFVVTMKVYWVAMWFRPARKDSIKIF